MKHRGPVAAALSAACLCSLPAHAIPLVQEMALHSMLEATTSVFTTLRDYAMENPDGISDGSGINALGSPIAWNGSFSNVGWTYSASGVFSGMALSMQYSGVISGSDGTDVLVTITGTGSLGSQPLAMTALSNWLFDSGAQDYLDMEFDHGTKIGANSRYGRVKGKEKVICMLDGNIVGDGSVPRVVAGDPVQLMATASSGKRSPYSTANEYSYGTKDCHLAPVQLTSVASLGKRGLATVSTIVVSLLSDQSLPPLIFPLAVLPGQEFDPANQATIAGADGGLYADDARNQFRSTGQYRDDGSFSGTLQFVPEPGSAWLTALALGMLAATRGRWRGTTRPHDES